MVVGGKENGLVYRGTGGDGWGSEGWWMEAGAASGRSRDEQEDGERAAPPFSEESHGPGWGVPENGAGVCT